MVKSLIELILIAVIFGSVQVQGVMPREVQDQAVRRLPLANAATLPRESTQAAAGLPVIAARDAWPVRKDEQSMGVLVSAGSAIVVDRASGRVLFEKDADAVRSIASLTKLMTALVFLESGPDFRQTITITDEDLGGEVSTVFAAGDVVSLRDVFFAAMVGSANDAARVMSRTTGLDEDSFVRRMNQKARELGMARTRFVEPTGLDAQNVSTARELVTLLQSARDIPIMREAAAQPVYRTAGSTQESQFVRTTNILLGSFLNRPPYQMALAKTGSLDEAGFCFAAAIDEGSHGVIAVVLGSETHFSRFDDMKALAYWALTRWQWRD